MITGSRSVKSEARSWLPEAAGWAAWWRRCGATRKDFYLGRRRKLTSCVWLLGTAGAAADAGELKRLLPDSMGKTPGVVDEVTEPIDEPMKEGISPAAGEGVCTR